MEGAPGVPPTPKAEPTPADLMKIAADKEKVSPATVPSGGSPRGLYVKLAEIMGELNAIPADRLRKVNVETRSGGSYSYDYITEATLMEELRPKLATRGVAVLYSDTILRTPAAEADDNLTIVKVTMTFVDGETGEKWSSSAEGYGTDTGDKGANKAKTSAMRYLLWKTFLFASPDDPETENVSRRSSGGRGGARPGKPISEKQVNLVELVLTKIDDAGHVDDAGRRPQDAVNVRKAVRDLDSQTASSLIDLLKRVEGTEPGTEGIADRLGKALDAILGPADESPGDFPPPEVLGEPAPGDEIEWPGEAPYA